MKLPLTLRSLSRSSLKSLISSTDSYYFKFILLLYKFYCLPLNMYIRNGKIVRIYIPMSGKYTFLTWDFNLFLLFFFNDKNKNENFHVSSSKSQQQTTIKRKRKRGDYYLLTDTYTMPVVKRCTYNSQKYF